MIRVGFVNLDTSHPAAFLKILRQMEDVRVTAVFDEGAVREESYIHEFCSSHDCKRYFSLDEMAQDVDAVMILGVNWDRHFDQSLPFVKAGKAVYIDKPVCGNARDVRRFEQLISESEAPFLAGSGWRFNQKVLLASRHGAASAAREFYVESCLPSYFYGIHAIELAIGLLGPGFTRVQTFCWDEQKAGVLLSLEHRQGKHVLVKMAPSQQYWRGALYRVGQEWHPVTFEAADIHGSVCGAFMEMARGGKPVCEAHSCLESVRIMLAARHAADTGKAVEMDAALPETVQFDGAAFEESYKTGK